MSNNQPMSDWERIHREKAAARHAKMLEAARLLGLPLSTAGEMIEGAEVDIDVAIEDDGIGPYEFWGQRGTDVRKGAVVGDEVTLELVWLEDSGDDSPTVPGFTQLTQTAHERGRTEDDIGDSHDYELDVTLDTVTMERVTAAGVMLWKVTASYTVSG